MSKELVSALVQVLISLSGAGILVQLLLLRANRRKIAGDASSAEANAASTLSGAAIQMVENAQRNERIAEQRADQLEERNAERVAEFERRRDLDSQELENRAWRIHHLEIRLAVLENALQQAGIELPPEPGYPRRGEPPQIDPRGPTPGEPPGLLGPVD